MTELSSSTVNENSNEMMFVSEQSLSTDNRLSVVHSRNSSKTLKCPKCNWHYKYQETLEIHMKEKHQIGTNNEGNNTKLGENEMNCSYCLTNSIHPRLARGEQYPCGFKPYRCDLCLYSTTTKGNLAIHMQSDKHINNTKDLSSSSSQQQNFNNLSPEHISIDQTSQSQEMKVATDSPSNDQLTCPLCSHPNLLTMDSLKEHLSSIHNCKKDSLKKCLALIEDSGVSSTMADNNNNNSSDEYRCHSCLNKTFKDIYLLLNHFQDQSHNEEDEKSVGLLCWKKGCNQYFHSLENLQKHFQEIHSTINFQEFDFLKEKSLTTTTTTTTTSVNFLSKSRERLYSIGEDIVLHYLENFNNENHLTNDIICDLCSKKFSSLSTLKVHYEDIHSIVLSSRAIQHWIFLLQKLHSPTTTTNENHHTKLKRQSSSSSIQSDTNQLKKKSRSNSYEDLHSLNYPLIQYDLSINNNKRQRTRITDQQLQILRAHFNINNSPTDEQINLMSDKTQLSTKVIKHWFRNTLFKERQRNKDSPYNFSNPPSNLNKFDLDEYQKTGTIIKKYQLNNQSDESDNDLTSNDDQDLLSDDDLNKKQQQQQQTQQQTIFNQSSSSSSSNSRRANRTRFSDQQLKYLQDAFEANPYPKDDDLEILSQKLKLNSRVIVVWFQNARQKARKSYENNQSDNLITNNNNNNNNTINNHHHEQTQYLIKQEKDDGYSCKNCQKLFTRFAELMKHAKQCSSSPSITTNNNKKSLLTKKKDFLETTNSLIDPISTYQILKSPSSSTSSYLHPNQIIQKKENYCDQCDQQFSSTKLFNEHQTLHMQALLNAAALFPLAAYHPAAAAAAAMAHLQTQFIQTNHSFKDFLEKETRTVPTNEKLKTNLSSSYATDSSHSSDDDDDQSLDSNDENNKKYSNLNTQKRNRTTILPEQQDYLMSKYSQESNPSRKMLEEISSEVKLKKRVVQVWFQNTRARERKGNIKIESNDNINKKCLHCSLTFKLKSTLENHLLNKHSDIYQTKEQLNLIDFDLFPTSLLLNSTDELPLDLSKTSIQINDDIKFENEQSNDSTYQSNDDLQQIQFPKQKHFSYTNTNGHLSPTDSQQSSNGFNSQRRFRTQMTPLQIKLMKAIFLEYRTPTMPECELLGKEIDLQKRVVQVWFQNARAKEKKNPNFFKSDLPQEYQPTNDFCHLCQFKYSIQNPQRDHLFTTKHIENIRNILSKQISTNSTIKDENMKKNSSQTKLDIQHSPTSSKDQQNQIMSYLNLMQLMPMSIDPFNYGLMDPNIHGTPLFMLHLPSEALNRIISANKSDVNLTSVQYTQDNLNIEQIFDNGYEHLDQQTIDVGYSCKRCNLVWPLYESCRCHALLCWQISSSVLPLTISNNEDLNKLSGYIFKIEQLLYRCLLCKTTYSTINEYEKHMKDQTHCKNQSSNSTIDEND